MPKAVNPPKMYHSLRPISLSPNWVWKTCWCKRWVFIRVCAESFSCALTVIVLHPGPRSREIPPQGGIGVTPTGPVRLLAEPSADHTTLWKSENKSEQSCMCSGKQVTLNLIPCASCLFWNVALLCYSVLLHGSHVLLGPVVNRGLLETCRMWQTPAIPGIGEQKYPPWICGNLSRCHLSVLMSLENCIQACS